MAKARVVYEKNGWWVEVYSMSIRYLNGPEYGLGFREKPFKTKEEAKSFVIKHSETLDFDGYGDEVKQKRLF